MREALLIVTCIALLLAAGGLLLWQWARSRQTRQATGRHLEQQILASSADVVPSVANVPMPLRDAPSESFVSGITSDPWLNTETTTGAPPRKGLMETVLPEWLLGVISPRIATLAVAGIVVACLVAGIFGGGIVAASVFFLLVLIAAFAVWLRLQKFRRQLISQLPSYIDAMVRLITIGNSTQAAFQLAIATTQEPLRGHMERSAALVRAGVDLDRALHQTATNVRVEEMFLLASIMGLGVRYGGRSDLLLERVANFMRDREQAEHELIAMSAETRLSAWILGLLPLGVGIFLVVVNPDYFMGMWNDETGRMLIFSSAGLQLLGAFLLYRLARLA
ncbi:Bacterial type II secretion system protein F domain protein [Variovorax boronicumulans]|uniref:type II secretion system F family protein n=1 Tax=Variovorax boronicumulans TaxID=436515 RepID=UPI0015521619|nr:type II secretion system F family protein [Variovorax boronicumulans]PBI92261.1 Bacterial type II secretion system protein F domain protein [Variovorax boronicumulans]